MMTYSILVSDDLSSQNIYFRSGNNCVAQWNYRNPEEGWVVHCERTFAMAKKELEALLEIAKNHLIDLGLMQGKADMKKMKFPSLNDVYQEILKLKKTLYPKDMMEIRLQVYPNWEWCIRTGDSQYDTDHRGYWGNSEVGFKSNCMHIAKNLLEQSKEDYYMCKD